MRKTPEFAAALASRGARTHFVVGICLVSIIPLLSFIFLFVSAKTGETLSPNLVACLSALLFSVMCLGLALLAKYPINIMRLRHYLEQLANEEIPVDIDLLAQEDDVHAIRECVQQVIFSLQHKARTIEEQSKALVQAERQRVMMESLGAACHHISQPLTAINLYLDLMRGNEQSPEMNDMIDECEKAALKVSKILDQFQTIRQYRTEPYCVSYGDDGNPASQTRIISLRQSAEEREGAPGEGG
jgi:signal transduction histidine kinase